jgi:hypothetical protein
MIEVTIRFTGETVSEVQEEAQNALKASDYLRALQDIRQEIFRPARKHGYPDTKLNELLNGDENVAEAIGLLEEKFSDLMREYEIDA